METNCEYHNSFDGIIFPKFVINFDSLYKCYPLICKNFIKKILKKEH